jgi:hypothetical protein
MVHRESCRALTFVDSSVVNGEKIRVLQTNFPALCGRCALLITLLSPSSAPTQEIVVHSAAEITELELSTLRAAFGMRLLEWPDGTRVVPFVMEPDSAMHIQFVKNVLQIFPYQLQQAWDRLVFSGTGQSPRVVSSPAEMRRRVSRTPGAIGYLPSEYLDGSVSAVEVIK